MNLQENIKYTHVYTYNKEEKIIYTEKNEQLDKNHILYTILEKYKNLLNILTNIKIIPHTSMEEADNGLIYKGFDSKGKEQYCYGINYIKSRNNKKLKNFLLIYKNMDQIQEIIQQGLEEKTVNKNFLFSTILLLELTYYIRLGKDIYLKTNETVGLLTLQKKHLQLVQNKIIISFNGKTGKLQQFICEKFEHPILFDVLKKLLLRLDDDNDYIFTTDDKKNFTERMLNKRLEKLQISLKDFRTYGVNMVLIKTFYEKVSNLNQTDITEKNIKKILSKSIEETADIIGHTKTISKKSYILNDVESILIEILLEQKKINFEIFTKLIINKLISLNDENKNK